VLFSCRLVGCGALSLLNSGGVLLILTMGLLKFIIVTLIIYLSLRVLWRIFGARILRYLLRRVTRKMEQNFWQQQNQQQARYDRHYEQELNLNAEVKLKVPHREKRMKSTKGAGIEDVPYEEIPE